MFNAGGSNRFTSFVASHTSTFSGSASLSLHSAVFAGTGANAGLYAYLYQITSNQPNGSPTINTMTIADVASTFPVPTGLSSHTASGPGGTGFVGQAFVVDGTLTIGGTLDLAGFFTSTISYAGASAATASGDVVFSDPLLLVKDTASTKRSRIFGYFSTYAPVIKSVTTNVAGNGSATALVAAPEPGSMILAGLGAGLLAFARRRKLA
jgi:hypothetical protein